MRLSMRRQRATKGFNLIEAAIVLGIVGLVVGGIWVAATSVYANLRSKRTSEQLLSIAQNIRALYATAAATGLADGFDMVGNLAQANILPTDTMTRTSALTTSADTANPWSGNIGIVATGGGTRFAITFSNVPTSACADLVMRNGGTGRDSGLVGISGSAASTNAVINTQGNPPSVTLNPGVGVTLAEAQQANMCATAAVAATRNITFLFNLKG